MPSHFHWTTFDVTGLLPRNWQRDISDVAAQADFREFPPTPVLTREDSRVASISRGRLHADQVQARLTWLYREYRETFLGLARQAARDASVIPAVDGRYGVVLNVQRGRSMRFECHVDSNPLTGLLFLTSHAEGGELVIGHDTGAVGIDAVERSCSVIRPHAAHLIFFDGREHPHYVRPLKSGKEVRVAAVMNFYTAACPESTRPAELNRHLYGDSQRAEAIVPLPRTVSPS